MFRFIYTFFLSCLFFHGLSAQGIVWANRLGGTSVDQGLSVTADPWGNTLVTGSFLYSVDLDPGPGTQNVTSLGNEDVFIQKINPKGELIWARQIGGTHNDLGVNIETDAAGNVLVLGRFGNTVDFDSGPGVFNMTQSLGMFLLKLDIDGNFVWAKSFDIYPHTTDYTEQTGNQLTLDAAGNIYLTAGFDNTVDFDPGPGVFNMTATGLYWDICVLKLDADGNFVWAKSMGAESYDSGLSIDVDAGGNVITSGFFNKTVDFDPGPGTFPMTSLGNDDVFIQKLDPDGNFLWAKRLGTLYYDEYASDMKVDASGHVYVIGQIQDYNVDMDPGPGVFNISNGTNKNIYVLKLNPDGQFAWAKTIAGPDGNDNARGIFIDAENNIYTTGFFTVSGDFDPDPDNEAILSVTGLYDCFLQKMDSSGQFIWAVNFGGPAEDVINDFYVNDQGDIYATGFFISNADFDPGSDTYTLQSSGSRDAFSGRWSQNFEFKGYVYEDRNQNGVREPGEPGIPGIVLTAEERGVFSSTNSKGQFRFPYDLLGDTVRLVLPESYRNWVADPDFALPLQPKDSADLAVTILPNVLDAGIHAVHVTPIRPGFVSKIDLHINNTGSLTADSVQVSFIVSNDPNPLEWTDISPQPSYVSSDSILWFFDSIPSLEALKLTICFRCDPDVALGTLISYSGELRMADKDTFDLDNFYSGREPVRYSFDPNDKTVSQDSILVENLDSTRLRYLIRFQNTGTFPAEFVVLRDTLPKTLDIRSLEMMSASHPYTWSLTGEGILEVRFDSIFLADSMSNEPGSHGYALFSIKPRHNLFDGLVINNRAGIYFDYNDPVITNFARTEIMVISSALSPENPKDRLDFKLSPNPVSSGESVAIELPDVSPFDVQVLDISGRTLLFQQHISGQRRIQLPVLPSGAYWVKVASNQQFGSKMLMIR